MGIFKKFLVLSVLLLGWNCYRKCNMVPGMPELDQNPWWGPEVRPDGAENTDVRPFKINVSQEDLNDLNTRLSLPLRVKTSLENSNFTLGFNSETLKVFHSYWLNKYNWRSREKKLNQFPHYMTQIEGLDIHFLHITPNPKDIKADTVVLPLLIIHGWPGSVVEFYDMIPLLTQSAGGKYAFEVICPSIPGFGFSQASSKKGMGSTETAQIFFKLMKRLNIPKFYVQGGDWGSLISSHMATMYPDNVLGMHINMVGSVLRIPTALLKLAIGAFLPSETVIAKEAEKIFYPLSKFISITYQESGYFHLQNTKPDTVGSALSNSPIGLAAYILEKFSTATYLKNPEKPDGGLLDPNFPIKFDRLLDNICLYWFTNSITSSMRFYSEAFSENHRAVDSIPSRVPSAFAVFPQELMNMPENLISGKYTDIVSYTRFPNGGHFAAMEQPEVLAADVRKFITTVEERKHEKKNEEL